MNVLMSVGIAFPGIPVILLECIFNGEYGITIECLIIIIREFVAVDSQSLAQELVNFIIGAIELACGAIDGNIEV